MTSAKASQRHVPRLYIKAPLALGQHLYLKDQVAHHLIHVLRMKVGAQVILFNHQTHSTEHSEYQATLIQVDKKAVQVQVCHHHQKRTESPLHITLGVCLIKNDRLDWLLQKATELGVTQVTPLTSQYSDIKLCAKRKLRKHEHWQQIMIHACEQSGRTRIPTLMPLTPLNDWIKSVDAEKKYLLQPGELDNKCRKKPHSIALLVGPAGGFSPQEVDTAKQYDFTPLVLGPRILRAETAPLAAITLLQYQFGDICHF